MKTFGVSCIIPASPLCLNLPGCQSWGGWDEYPEVRKLRYTRFTEVLAAQFNIYYGVNAEKLEPWQDLCQALRLDPIPDTLKHARDVRLLYTSEGSKATSADVDIKIGCSRKTRLYH